MKKRSACGMIRIDQRRAICPRCGGKLPGVFRPGCVVQGLTLRCKYCHAEIEIRIPATGDQASSVQDFSES